VGTLALSCRGEGTPQRAEAQIWKQSCPFLWALRPVHYLTVTDIKQREERMACCPSAPGEALPITTGSTLLSLWEGDWCLTQGANLIQWHNWLTPLSHGAHG